MYYMECGGVENALVNLLETLDPEDYQVDLYFLEQKGAFLNRLPRYVNRISLPLTDIERHFAIHLSARELLQYGFKNKLYLSTLRLIITYAIKKAFGSQAPAYETILRNIPEKNYDLALDFHGYLSLSTVFLIKKIKAKKHYTWIHSEGFIENLPKMKQYINKYDQILCVSEECQKLVHKALPEYNEDCIRLCYNILHQDEILEKSKIGPICKLDKDALKLVTVGRLSVQKGQDIAIETANILKTKGLNFHWWFCGDGETRKQIEDQILQMNLQEEITLLGFCDNPYGYMASADIYVQPSRYEGYAVTVTEASALGCVIVSTDVSGAAEEIEHGKSGLITSASAESLANAIMQIAENPQTLSSMRNFAHSQKEHKTDITILEELLRV